MKKLLTSGIEAGNKVKAVREVVKTYNRHKQDMFDETAEILKPSIDVQKEVKKTIDDRTRSLNSWKIIKQKMVEAIEFDPTKAITFEGKKLPELNWVPYESEDEGKDEDEGEDEDEDEEVKPSTSEKKPQYLNLDKGITVEYKNLLEDKGLPIPSEIFKKGSDPNELITKVNSKIKRNQDYIKEHSTKKGEPYKKWKKIQLSTYQRHKMELPYLQDYLVRLNYIKAAPKYMGEGIHTQKKRNAYKISQNGQYGGLVIDLPKLHGHLKVVAHKSGRKVYDKHDSTSKRGTLN